MGVKKALDVTDTVIQSAEFHLIAFLLYQPSVPMLYWSQSLPSWRKECRHAD